MVLAMDKYYIYYLKLLGYKNYYDQNIKINNLQKIINNQMNQNNNQINNDIEMQINNEVIIYNVPNKIHNTVESNNKRKYIFNKIYKCIILFLIFWKIIFVLYNTITKKDVTIIYKNLYDCGIPFQYYFGYKYFSTNHFINIINRAKMSYYSNYKKFINFYLLFLLSFSIIFAITEIILTVTINQNNGLDLFNIINNTNTITFPILLIILFFSNLYSINIFFINVYAFSIVFRIHSLDLEFFYNKLMLNNNFIPSELCNNLIRLRNEYEKSQDKLNYTFSTIVFFGGLSTYFVLLHTKNHEATMLQYLYALLFIIISSIYFRSILITKSLRRELHSFSYSAKMIEKLITRKKLYNNTNNNNNHSVILDAENAETIDWLITYTIFGDEWDNFRLFGFSFDDINLLKKALVFLVAFYIGEQFSQIIGFFL
jgi:hypothetical protein